jgi:hypothetical protein
MKYLVPVVLVLIAVYGATVAVRPQLAVRRGDLASPVKVNIARFKGVLAFALSAFLLWRTLR